MSLYNFRQQSYSLLTPLELWCTGTFAAQNRLDSGIVDLMLSMMSPLTLQVGVQRSLVNETTNETVAINFFIRHSAGMCFQQLPGLPPGEGFSQGKSDSLGIQTTNQSTIQTTNHILHAGDSTGGTQWQCRGPLLWTQCPVSLFWWCWWSHYHLAVTHKQLHKLNVITHNISVHVCSNKHRIIDYSNVLSGMSALQYLMTSYV